MEDLKPVETLTPYEAARMIHANAEYIRAGLRSQRLPFVNFGSATPPKKPGGKWSYNIVKSKFLKEYAGIIEGVNRNENKFLVRILEIAIFIGTIILTILAINYANKIRGHIAYGGEYLIPIGGLLIILVIETIYEESESKKRGGKNGRK